MHSLQRSSSSSSSSFCCCARKITVIEAFFISGSGCASRETFFSLSRGLEQISKTGNSSFSAHGGRFCLGPRIASLEEQLFQLGSNFVRHSTSLAHGKKMHFSPLSSHVGKAGGSAEKKTFEKSVRVRRTLRGGFLAR